MKNSGYVSIGHILSSKSNSQDYVRTLRSFCTVLFCNTQYNVIDQASGMWTYDQFFKTVDIGLETFAKFVNGILRKHDADELDLQLQVECVAWDMVKFNFDKYCICEESPEESKKDIGGVDRRFIFKLFCIFNRFCDPRVLPLTLPPKATAYINQRLGISTPKDLADLSFEELVASIVQRRDSFVMVAVKKLYDEVVRDVIIEGRIKFKMVRDASLNNSLMGLKNATGSPGATPKNVVLTTKHLIVYDDDPNDTNQLDAPKKLEPSGKVRHKISLMGAESSGKKNGGIFTKQNTALVIRANGGNTVAELVFNPVRDHYIMYKWTMAVQEAADCLKLPNGHKDRLTQIAEANQLRNSLSNHNSQTTQSLANHPLPTAKSATNMTLICPSEGEENHCLRVPVNIPDTPRRRSAPDLPTGNQFLFDYRPSHSVEEAVEGHTVSVPVHHYAESEGQESSISDELCLALPQLSDVECLSDSGVSLNDESKEQAVILPPSKPKRKFGTRQTGVLIQLRDQEGYPRIISCDE